MAYKLNKPYTDAQRADFIVKYNHNNGLKIEEAPTALYALEVNEIIQNGEPTLNPNYELEQQELEKARIQGLSMTRSDFFDGTIKAFGLGKNELQIAIESVLSNLNINEIEKAVALNNYENALNFYRKHPLFEMLSGIKIPISTGSHILITPEQWDRFFDETNKGNMEAYKQLLPIQEALPEINIDNNIEALSDSEPEIETEN